MMRNSSELKRIENEKRIVREMEAERLKQMIAAEKAKLEGQDRHDAVTLIAARFRGRKARVFVREKRAQLQLEGALILFDKCRAAAGIIQRNMRGYMCRAKLQAGGFPVPSSKQTPGKTKKKNKRMKMLMDAASKSPEVNLSLKAVCAARAQYELIQRLTVNRRAMFETLNRSYIYVVQV